MDRMETEARRLLNARRQKLVTLFESTRADEAELQAGREPDFIEQAAGDSTANVLAGLSDRERTELQEIDAALARIADGTYGKCQRCGGAIGRQRLRAVPEARLCVECSEEGARR